MEEAPVSLPEQRMVVQICGPELAQTHTSTHERRWGGEGIICLFLLSQFGPSPAQCGSWPDTNVLPQGKPAWAACPARSHEEGGQ